MSQRYITGKEALKSHGSVSVCPLGSKVATFALTFWSYAIMKAANKSYSLIQPTLVESEWFRSKVYDNGYGGQTEMVGLISTLFLCCYAAGQFFVGTLADKTDLRYFLSGAMVAAGSLTVLFGLLGIIPYHGVWIYCIVWSLNGFAQACGWPSNLTVMNNWFGKKGRGVVFSAWSSNSNFGNVLGSVICGAIFVGLENYPNVWQMCMIICGSGAIVGALPIFFCLVPDPNLLTMKRKPLPTKQYSKTRVIPVRSKSDLQSGDIEMAPNDVMNENNVMTPRDDEMDRYDSNNTELDYPRQPPEEDEPIPQPVALKKDELTKQQSFKSSVSEYLSGLKQGITTRGVIPYAIIYACVKGVVYIYIYWIPLFLTSSKGMSNSTAAMISSVFDIGSFVGAIASGYITDKLGSRTLVILIMIGVSMILPYIMFSGLIQSDLMAAMILCVIGLTLGGAQILISASVSLDLGDSAVDQNQQKVSVEQADGEETKQQQPYSLTNNSQDQEFNKKKKLSGTISGIIEGCGSAGAALLQYLVGLLLVCNTTNENTDAVVCTWKNVLTLITVANLLCLMCLFYIKFSNRIRIIYVWIKESMAWFVK